MAEKKVFGDEFGREFERDIFFPDSFTTRPVEPDPPNVGVELNQSKRVHPRGCLRGDLFLRGSDRLQCHELCADFGLCTSGCQGCDHDRGQEDPGSHHEMKLTQFEVRVFPLARGALDVVEQVAWCSRVGEYPALLGRAR